MASDIEDICDEIVTYLTGLYPGVFSSIERVTVPRFDPESLNTGSPVINVVGAGRTSENINRGSRQYTYTVLIFIAQAVPAVNGNDTDDLQELTVEISNHLERLSLTAARAREQSVAVTLFDADALQTENRFQSLITLTLVGGHRSV